ncbi:tetratricopeptide repeat protein, partial [Myxococcota bacterium]|nr:tetratricopeptide repeat protein [Myxococcota bacterium]
MRALTAVLLLAAPSIGEARPAAPSRPGPAKSRARTIEGHRYVGSQAYHHALRAELARARGELAIAAQELQLALVYDEASPHLNAELADVSLGIGAVAKAERASGRALELEPGRAAHWVLRAKVLEATGDRAGAERALRRAIELAPADVEAP